MPPPIQVLTKKLIEVRGIEYNLAYKVLKDYIEKLSDAEFEAEVERVTNVDIFRYLQSVGLPFSRLLIVTDKWRRMVE